MRIALTTLSLILAFAAPAISQYHGTPCLPGGDPATLVDAFTVTLDISGNTEAASGGGAVTTPPGGEMGNTSKDKKVQFQVDVAVWNVQGRPVIAISTGEVGFEGDPAGVEKMPASEIFTMLTQAAIGQAVGRKSLRCTAECGGYLVEVVQPACVFREITERGMVLKTCNLSDCCVKTYMVCCPTGSGSPVVKEVSSKSSGCTSSGCESTCQ